jgi:hypothetical protein
LEICIKLIYNLENPSIILLILLKNEDKIKNIHQKFSNVFNKKIKNDLNDSQWENYIKLMNILDNIYKKIKINLNDNGGDVKFSPNNEVINFNFIF